MQERVKVRYYNIVDVLFIISSKKPAQRNVQERDKNANSPVGDQKSSKPSGPPHATAKFDYNSGTADDLSFKVNHHIHFKLCDYLKYNGHTICYWLSLKFFPSRVSWPNTRIKNNGNKSQKDCF